MTRSTDQTNAEARFVPVLAGVVYGLVFLKLGNPVIFDAQIDAPAGVLEALFMSWPVSWGYALLAGLILAGAGMRLRRPAERPVPSESAPTPPARAPWLLWLPVVWIVWQCLAATQTVDARLTRLALPQLIACVASFGFGYLMLGRVGCLRGLWIGLLAGFALTLWFGLDQHFGGLEETRRQFDQLPPEMRARLDTPALRERMQSNRIFSTFVYPNAFAGGILLLLPLAIQSAWKLGSRLSSLDARLSPLVAPRILAAGLAAITATAGLACLYWSGSKAGWLIMLIVIIAALLHAPAKRQIKLLLLGGLLIAGLAGFFLKYAAYFERGATSVGARMDYWRAALTIAEAHPVLGTGPGTFSVLYARMKSPQAEMARLTHNDYLQQACDSGWLACLAYTVFLAGSLVCLRKGSAQNGLRFAVWLGLLGWALQGFMEFGLYIPALAWTAFMQLGCLWSSAK